MKFYCISSFIIHDGNPIQPDYKINTKVYGPFDTLEQAETVNTDGTGNGTETIIGVRDNGTVYHRPKNNPGGWPLKEKAKFEIDQRVRIKESKILADRIGTIRAVYTGPMNYRYQIGVDGLRYEFDENDLIAETEPCKECKGTKCIKVGGSGGDYEDWPCSQCRPEEYQTALRQSYGGGSYDGDGD